MQFVRSLGGAPAGATKSYCPQMNANEENNRLRSDRYAGCRWWLDHRADVDRRFGRKETGGRGFTVKVRSQAILA
jgi:hypothetical protein